MKTRNPDAIFGFSLGGPALAHRPSLMNPPDKTNPADHNHDDKRRVTQLPEKSGDCREREESGTQPERNDASEEKRPTTGDHTSPGTRGDEADADGNRSQRSNRPSSTSAERAQQSKNNDRRDVQDAERRGMSDKHAEDDGS